MPIDQDGGQSRHAQRLKQARASYPFQWSQIISDWQLDGPDAAWMMYSANYLLRTAGLRWAIDPLLLSSRIGGLDLPHAGWDLNRLDLIVLTHAHKDHLDLNLLSQLVNQPILWVIPEHTLSLIHSRMAIPMDRIIVPVNGQPIQAANLTLTAFDGLHQDGSNGIQATGYLAEFNQKRWLFPGDTRCYDRSALPEFGKLDGVFAHLWLGRASALIQPPPLLESFCQFFLELNADRIVISHLAELGRDEFDLWDEDHFRSVAERLAQLEPGKKILKAMTGDRIEFDAKSE
jgi:L-ascorbate metabolism protein UlaG (beta-lactamase superfamily)